MDRKAVSYNLLVSTIAQARAFLNTQSTVTGVDLRLKRIRSYLKSVGNPERKLRVIHVAGTVGKGSTCTFAAQLLNAANLKVGLFLSPHLVDYTERIQILNIADCGLQIADSWCPADDLYKSSRLQRDSLNPQSAIRDPQFLCYFNLIRKNILGKKLTPFETLTAMAVHYFVDEHVDVAVFEVGLGGRLDATNALKTEVSVITKIGLDHTQWLGDTIEKIAAEKFGIIRPHVPVVLSAREGSLLKKCSTFRVPHSAFVIKPISLPPACPLKGPHQKENAALALKAVELFLKRKLSVPEKKTGFETAFIPGRLQWITLPLGNVFLDGAHNADSAKVLAQYLKRNYPRTRWHFIVGILQKKDAPAMLKHWIPLAESFSFVPVPGSAYHPPEDLCALVKSLNPKIPLQTHQTWKQALPPSRQPGSQAARQLPPTCITGSLYLAGSVLKTLPSPIQ